MKLNGQAMYCFEIVWKLEILHAYFKSEKCRVMHLRPQPVTQRQLDNLGAVFKQTDVNKWVIAGDPRLLLPALCEEEASVLAFDLHISDPQFLYYTPSLLPDAEENKENCRCERKPDTLKTLSVYCRPRSTSDADSAPAYPLEYRLSYPAARRYWEYILISRSASEETRVLSLSDTDKQFSFGPAETFEWQAGPAYRIRTAEPVLLKEYYPTTIQLYEKRMFGKDNRETVKRLLDRHVPPPVPGRFTSGPPDTLRQIIYF